ncbi:dTDP-4-dehydrorhamnose reductase [Sphaerisporangium rufum]|uniref:dTDP-4-dehydrorhamnose reductase n=1 Tax=Sphaerisporangium rufum TaxID=1381558 RepID=A0A919R4G7_9ACTN|nr:sugar nucleotide-binding protein [Sphaerisporangium rufum]GII76970.1 dTDP-4-dehydrorhamnose reductase [Sphaerisporangium rufum]
MRIMVIGGSGLLGRELVRQGVAAGYQVMATYLTRPGAAPEVTWTPLDVRDRDAVPVSVRAARPDMIVNAAYRQADWAVTADGAAHVALAAAATGARLVHVSSDAVFSGAAVTYAETAVPDPGTPYGAAKAAAEVAVRAVAPDAVIARTSLIIGDHGDSPHEELVHALAAGRERDKVLFTDEVRCPVHVADLAAALLELAHRGHQGMCHVAGADAVSRHELGRLIARRDGLDPGALPAAPRGAAPGRALDVRLDCAATARLLRTRLRGAPEFLR